MAVRTHAAWRPCWWTRSSQSPTPSSCVPDPVAVDRLTGRGDFQTLRPAADSRSPRVAVTAGRRAGGHDRLGWTALTQRPARVPRPRRARTTGTPCCRTPRRSPASTTSPSAGWACTSSTSGCLLIGDTIELDLVHPGGARLRADGAGHPDAGCARVRRLPGRLGGGTRRRRRCSAGVFPHAARIASGSRPSTRSTYGSGSQLRRAHAAVEPAGALLTLQRPGRGVAVPPASR